MWVRGLIQPPPGWLKVISSKFIKIEIGSIKNASQLGIFLKFKIMTSFQYEPITLLITQFLPIKTVRIEISFETILYVSEKIVLFNFIIKIFPLGIMHLLCLDLLILGTCLL